jgi:hypothetical protein
VEQAKYIPAMNSLNGRRISEQNATGSPRRVVVANTAFGQNRLVICRDLLNIDLRVEIKNFRHRQTSSSTLPCPRHS